MPKLNKKNGLEVHPIPESVIQLTDLESNVIAKNLIFQKVHKMPKSRWSGTHDRLVNVPVHDDDVLNTIKKLPRTPVEAGIVSLPITVNLKRKMEYKNSHIQQIVSPANIYNFLDFLKQSGHPGYQFYNSKSDYESRCEIEDPLGLVWFGLVWYICATTRPTLGPGELFTGPFTPSLPLHPTDQMGDA